MVSVTDEEKERCEGRIPSQATNVKTWCIDCQEIKNRLSHTHTLTHSHTHTHTHRHLADRWDTDACYVEGPLRPWLINPMADRLRYIWVSVCVGWVNTGQLLRPNLVGTARSHYTGVIMWINIMNNTSYNHFKLYCYSEKLASCPNKVVLIIFILKI